jgi:hypothetical protein
MKKSDSIKEICSALVKFHGEVKKIKKTAINPFFKSKYADLSSILDVIEEPLCEAGLSFVQFPIGENELTTVLMHVSGEWIEGSYTMKPTKNDPQGLGSAITYQRRYALGAILGLNIDIDDDGNKACEKPTVYDAIKEMNATKDIEMLQSIWTKYKSFQKETKFVEAKDKRKTELDAKQ